jgi:hypothetical protein
MDNVEIKIYSDKDAWLDGRKTHFTSSRINSLMATVKRKMTDIEREAYAYHYPKSKATTIEDETLLSDGAISYILERIQNQLSESKPNFYNFQMQWGEDTEPQAVLAIAKRLGYFVNDSNFIYTSAKGVVNWQYKKIASGTPDIWLRDRNEIVEIKCPNSDTHLNTMLFYTPENFQEKEPIYYDQMQFNMMLTGATLCHFASFDPRFKDESLQLFGIIIKADAERQAKIFNKLLIADEMRNFFLNKLTQKFNQ